MAALTAPTDLEPARFGTQQLATALGLSRIALGTIVAAKYVTTSVRADGPGHPRRFTFVDACQLAVFCTLYRHWPGSTVTLGWLVDALLDRDQIDFRTWPQSPTNDRRPTAVPPREAIIDRIELLTRFPTLRPAWHRHRDLSGPFHILVTDTVLDVTQRPNIAANDGIVVNLTRAIVDLEDVLTREGRPARSDRPLPVRQCRA